jgi:hypothetical protein
MKNNNDFLIYIDECFCPELQCKNELYKCNIKILKVYDDDSNWEYDYEDGYKHDAELKYCEPCYIYNDPDLNIDKTNNNMDEEDKK